VKLSPINLRPGLLIRPEWNAKAMALVGSAYARLWAAAGDRTAQAQAGRWLDWLVANSTAEVGLGWGYHFDVQTRFFAYRRGTPNVIATSFAAHALLDGYELLEDDRWANAALEACHFLVLTLREEEIERVYFRYLPAERELVHNANVLACSVLARTGALSGRDELEEHVRQALPTTLAAQHPDGSWPYSEAHGWVDNFHTGYVLEGLAFCDPLVPGVRLQLERGLDFWERELFLPDGTPKYFPERAMPLDAHNYAQAIETWLSVRSWRPEAFHLASRCAEQLVHRMLTPDGHVAFQERRLFTSRVPFVRWTAGPSFRALAGLELASVRTGASRGV
jgi:polysaccharide biosynthesis protein VpsJ